jgi:hypothetical protein
MRKPLVPEHFAKGANCLLIMFNSNFISVRETCEEVRGKLKD